MIATTKLDGLREQPIVTGSLLESEKKLDTVIPLFSTRNIDPLEIAPVYLWEMYQFQMTTTEYLATIFYIINCLPD